ncbi:MAG: hypothetical protein FJZ01_11910 [Candidatus Sericytochromatia bacterium]|nr:hypothetical protein [Candidatus Tanganyikabacteria bacterium]
MARWYSAILASLLLVAHPALAAPDKKVRGPLTVTPGTNDGKTGLWVSFHEYTLRDFSAEFNDLLSWNGRASKLSGNPVTGSTPGSAYDNQDVEFNHDIDFGAINRVLDNPSYVGQHGNKREWIRDYAQDTGNGFKIRDRGCTASSLLEASRLARIYELLSMGVEPVKSTMSGYHVAFYSDHPYNIPLTKDAVLAKLKEVFKLGIDTYSPIVLDLNHDGRIGVTGRSTAAIRNPKNLYQAAGSVVFDLRGFGEKKRYEWLAADGDGFLVDDRSLKVSQAAESGAEVDGTALFGNAVGYDNGFHKLQEATSVLRTAALDLFGLAVGAPDSRKVATGNELRHLKVWIDANRDARPQPAEVFALQTLGITEVGLQPRFVRNRDGEWLIQSHFVQAGHRFLSEDVWFAEEPKGK